MFLTDEQEAFKKYTFEQYKRLLKEAADFEYNGMTYIAAELRVQAQHWYDLFIPWLKRNV